LSVPPEHPENASNQQQQQQQQSYQANAQQNLSQFDATLVNGTRQPSVRFDDVRVYGVDDPLPGHSRWTDEELAQRHGAATPMDVDVPADDNNDIGEIFQVR